MRLPSCLRQAMGDELGGQVNVVEAEITKVVREIEEVKAELKVVIALLADLTLPAERRTELVAGEQRLGKKEEQLRAQDLLLTAKLQPPGVVPLRVVFIVHAQPASLLAAASALCTRFSLLSLALAAIGFISWNWAQTTASSN